MKIEPMAGSSLDGRPVVASALGPVAAVVVALLVVACATGPSMSPLAPGPASSPSPASSASPSGPPSSPTQSPAVPSGRPEAQARIRCEVDGATTLLTPIVLAQPDGIHIVTENPTDQDRAIDVEGIGGDNAWIGETETIWQVGPGRIEVRCFDPDLDAALDIGWVTLTVVDAEGWFGPTELECPTDERFGMDIDYVADASGAAGDPLELSLARVRDDEPSYTVEPAGYTSETRRQVRVLDDGRPIALLDWEAAPAGGWLLAHVEACAGVDLDWSD